MNPKYKWEVSMSDIIFIVKDKATLSKIIKGMN